MNNILVVFQVIRLILDDSFLRNKNGCAVKNVKNVFSLTLRSIVHYISGDLSLAAFQQLEINEV